LHQFEELKDSVIDKIKEQTTKPLDEVALLFKGMAVRDRAASVGENKSFGKDIFLLGKSINNYEISKFLYTNYSDLIIDGGTKKLSQYQIVPRILVRRTGNTMCSSYLDFADFDDFNDFDIIYTMDESNHTNVVAMASSSEDASKVKMLLNEISPESNSPVPDPYFGSDGFENVYQLVNQACDKICDNLESNG